LQLSAFLAISSAKLPAQRRAARGFLRSETSGRGLSATR
jgi:hypothetical protein